MIKAEKKLKTEDEFLSYLNREIYSDDYPKLPLRIDVSDKFVIQAEKYLSVIRSRYEKTKKRLADKTFFVDGDAQDTDIEMSGDSMDESEQDSIATDDDNLYNSDEADQKEQRRTRFNKKHVSRVDDVIKEKKPQVWLS